MAFSPSHVNTRERSHSSRLCSRCLQPPFDFYCPEQLICRNVHAQQSCVMMSASERCSSGSTQVMTSCGWYIHKAEGEIAFTRVDANTVFSGNWGWRVGVFVWGVFSPQTPQLILLVSLSFLSPLARLQFVVLHSFLLSVKFSHVKCLF